jgi:hypothetical protein
MQNGKDKDGGLRTEVVFRSTGLEYSVGRQARDPAYPYFMLIVSLKRFALLSFWMKST